MLALPDEPDAAPKIALSALNFGAYPMVSHETRLQRRFYGDAAAIEAARAAIGQPLDADAALALGLVTTAPDDIDWDDEIRIALEERASMSPDALTGMEANLRFAGAETMESRIFGRLTAWQNWIFIRPNAVGEKRRAEGLRHRREGRNSTGTACDAAGAGVPTTRHGSESPMSIDYSQKIPNNVNLASDRTLQRALEQWQPNFIDWWTDIGPDGSPTTTSTCAPRPASIRRAGRTSTT